MIRLLRTLFARRTICRCGHHRDAHLHYTVPGDLRCGLCTCAKFQGVA